MTAVRELRDRWRVVCRATQSETSERSSSEISEDSHDVSRTIRQSYHRQRARAAMWQDDRLYASFAEDPRELDDIIVDTSSLP